VVDVIGSLEKHVERQQSESENREATAASASESVKEKANEEELNVEELHDGGSSGGGDDLVQPNNDVTGNDGNGSPVLAATTTAVTPVGGKKRSRESASSTRNTRTQTRSTKQAKLSHSTLHKASEVAGTTIAQPRVVRRSFEGTGMGIEAEEEPVVEEDVTSLDDGDDDHDDEDGNTIIVAEHDQQVRVPKKSFDERFTDLMDYKQKFGHCDVPQTNSGEYKSLGNWCTNLRTAYKKIQKNETSNHTLTKDNIQKLEDAGFKWRVSTSSTFDERFAELMKFKEKVGHCNAPQKRSGEYKSLGSWCSDLRTSYKKIQKKETPKYKLTEENIQQLEDAGFKLSLTTFDKRYAELMRYKEKVGHCNVPQKRSGEHKSLGNWCSGLRKAYKKIQNEETPNCKLSEEHIRQLEDAGFKWSLSTFDERYAELMRYKEKFHHCDVPQRGSVEYPSLGIWCHTLRSRYKKIQNNETPHHKLSEDHIRQLEDAGFKWSLRQST